MPMNLKDICQLFLVPITKKYLTFWHFLACVSVPKVTNTHTLRKYLDQIDLAVTDVIILQAIKSVVMTVTVNGTYSWAR